MKKITRCDLCSSKDIRKKFKLKDRLYGLKGEFEFYICNNCGLIFQNPQLSGEELSPYYPKDYIAYDTGESKRDGMIGLLYKTYYSKEGNKILKALFLPVKSLLRSMPIKERARYLDIGCGNGRFLRFVKENNMEPHGADPFLENPIEELNVKNVSLEEAGYPDSFFDFITLNNVLEHVHNPAEILKECNRILKKDGKIFVNVPNSSSLNRYLFSSEWVSLDPPRHLYIFSNKTLKMYGLKSGLKISRINHKSESFTILGSILYKINKITGRKSKLAKSRVLANPFVNIAFLPIALFFNALGIGDQTEVVYVKK